MSTELSAEDANTLFNEIAASGGDPIKLNKLMTVPQEEDTGNPDVITTEDTSAIVDDTTTVDDVTGDDNTEDTTSSQSTEDTSANRETQEGDDATDEDPKIKELRDQLEKLSKENHSLRSQAGRVPHVQRKLKELDKKLEELNQKAASPSDRPSAKIQPKVLEKLKGIRETDPELADAIAAAMAEASDSIAEENLNRERETLQMLRAQEAAEYRQEQVNLLLAKYPNAAQVVNSPSWSEWKKEQSEGVLRLAESDHADEVSLAFDLYAKAMRIKYPQLNTDQAATTATTVARRASTDAEAAKAAQIEEERRRRKETAASAVSPAAAGKVSLPDDPQALFQKYSEEIRKKMYSG